MGGPKKVKGKKHARPKRSSGCTRSSDGIKTQTVRPSAETEVMPFWALLASGQIHMRKIDGRKTLIETLSPKSIDLAA
jgi:hypothetical protein